MKSVNSYSFGSSVGELTEWIEEKQAERDERLKRKGSKYKPEDFLVLIQFEQTWANGQILPGQLFGVGDFAQVKLEDLRRIAEDGCLFEIKEVGE